MLFCIRQPLLINRVNFVSTPLHWVGVPLVSPYPAHTNTHTHKVRIKESSNDGNFSLTFFLGWFLFLFFLAIFLISSSSIRSGLFVLPEKRPVKSPKTYFPP